MTSLFKSLNLAKPLNYQIIAKRCVPSTAKSLITSESIFASEGGWFKRLRHNLGMGEANIFALRRATIFHYEACTDKLSAELHVWMCQARSMAEGKEGRILRNEVVERMWQDMDVRISKIDVFTLAKRKLILNDLLFHHQGAIFSYDEGLLTNDKVLAGALWRTLFSKEDVDPRVLEMAVKYVRIQMNHLRSIGPREWCLEGKFDWAHYQPLITSSSG